MNPISANVKQQKPIETDKCNQMVMNLDGSAEVRLQKKPEMHGRSMSETELNRVADAAVKLSNTIESIKHLPTDGEKLKLFLECAKELENVHPALLQKLARSLISTMPFIWKADTSKHGDVSTQVFKALIDLAQRSLQDPAKMAGANEILAALPAMLTKSPLQDKMGIFLSLKEIMKQQLSKLDKKEYSNSLAANIRVMLASLSGAIDVLPLSPEKVKLQKELSECITTYANIPEDGFEGRLAALERTAQIENAARSYKVLLSRSIFD